VAGNKFAAKARGIDTGIYRAEAARVASLAEYREERKRQRTALSG
jgi:hypothetical protein